MQEVINIFLSNPTGQTFGLIWMLSVIYAFIQQDDTKVMKTLFVSNIFWAIHFFFLEVYTWLAIVIVSLIRFDCQ